jgi:mono/diheme cytochrome c family protein
MKRKKAPKKAMPRRQTAILSVLALCVALGLVQESVSQKKSRASGLAGAPESAHARANPFAGRPEAIRAGRKLFERYCAECHGDDLRGRAKAPALDAGLVQAVPPGDLFWFLTNGNLWGGMPSWSRLPEAQRWQIVTYLKSLSPPVQPSQP